MAGPREQVEAIDRAVARNDWYVKTDAVLAGPMSKAEARARVRLSLSNGRKPKLLRVVEDYES